MINIIKGTWILTEYNYSNKSTELTLSNHQRKIFFITANSKDILENYQSCFSKVDLSKYKRLYFNSASLFPRNRLSNLTKITRALKLKNVDAVVVPNTLPLLSSLGDRKRVV